LLPKFWTTISLDDQKTSDQIKVLPPYRCAGLLLWDRRIYNVEAEETLLKPMREAGLEHTGECQEWTYFFLGVESPHNLMGIYMGVKNA
jgi:hypothetical protein